MGPGRVASSWDFLCLKEYLFWSLFTSNVMYFLMLHYKYVSYCLTQVGFQNVALKSSKIVKQSLLVLEILSLLLNYLQGMHTGNTRRAPLSLGTKPNCSVPLTTLFFWWFFFWFSFFFLILFLSIAHHLSVLFQSWWHLWQIIQPGEWHYELAACDMLPRWTAVALINVQECNMI